MNKFIVMAIIAVVAATVGVLVYAKKNKAEADKLKQALETFLQSPAFKETVRKIMRAAEELIVGDGKGKERLKYVCGAINAMLPIYLQPVVTAERLEKFVNLLFTEFSKEKDGHTVVE